MSDEYLKLTTYFAERLRSGDRFVADALLDFYGESAVATSVVLRGIASFGPHHVLRSDQLLSASEDSPIVIAAPLKIVNGSGSPVRVLALVPEA